MKEHIVFLTKKAQSAYAGGSTTSMANTQPVTFPQKEQQAVKTTTVEGQPAATPDAKSQPAVSPQRLEAARKSVEKFIKKRAQGGDPVTAEERQTLMVLAARGIELPPIGGGSGEVSEPITPALNFIAKEINQEVARHGEQGLRPRYLEEQLRRVRDLVDKGTLTAPEARAEAHAFISELNQRIDEASGSNGAEDGEENVPTGSKAERKRQVAEMLNSIPLTTKDTDVNLINPDTFTKKDIKDIAQEVIDAIEDGKTATSPFFQEIEDKIGKIFQDNNPREHEPEIKLLLNEAKDLRVALAKIRQDLTAKRNTESEASLSTLYGEIRPDAADERAIVNNAIIAVLQRGTSEGDAAEKVLEGMFNKLFIRATVNSNKVWRDALGAPGQIEFDLFLMALGNAAAEKTHPLERKLFEKEINALHQKAKELQAEAEFREFFHDLTFYINRNTTTEEMHGAVKRFPGEYIDKAYQMRGVTQVDHFFEQAMFQVMTKNGWYLPYEAMINSSGKLGEVEELVYKMIDNAAKNGGILAGMEVWEIDRAVSLARGLRIAMGRALEVVAQGGISVDTPLVSWWANPIIKKLAFYKQIARYNIGFERNRILGFNTAEEGSFAWQTNELEKVTTNNVIKRTIQDLEDEIEFDKTNPMRCGGVKTQTGWRFGKDKVFGAGVISKLLNGYDYNPIIGAGMWIEKERRNLIPVQWKEKIADKEETIAELKRTFTGEDDTIDTLDTQGALAEFLIRKNLELATEVTPLKLFYNDIKVRHAVLRSFDTKEKSQEFGYSEQQVKDHGEDKIQIIGTSPNDPEKDTDDPNYGRDLGNDLSMLAVAQEKLLAEREQAYKDWVQNGKKSGERPDLYTQHIGLEAAIRAVCEDSKYPERGQQRAERVVALAKLIQGKAKPRIPGIVEMLRDKGWKVPFIFGEDDIPHDLYHWAATGGSSIERRWGDMESVDKAAGKMEEFIEHMTMFRSQDDIIKELYDIYQTLRGHDEGVAAELITRWGEGVIKFYKKDWISRLPLGFGAWAGFAGGLAGGKSSYAQVVYGTEQMAWDEIDIDQFIKKLLASGSLGEDKVAKDNMKRLRKQTGAAWWNIFMISIPRTATGLGILGFIYYMLTKAMPDEYKKAA